MLNMFSIMFVIGILMLSRQVKKKLYSSLDIVKKHSVLDNNNTVFGD